MDINICIDYLGLGGNRYKLDNPTAPHVITEWSGSDPQPTNSELEAAWVEVQKLQYKDQRASAYPSIADQLDQIYHEGIDAWKETIAAVKAEYPKP